MDNVTAAILAGGEGKRFKPFTDIVSKPMIPVGDEEKPIVEYILSWLKRHGIQKATLLVGYKWKQIYNYFRDGKWLGINVKYSVDSEEYKNTGGSLAKAVLTGVITDPTIIVWYGDILASVNVTELLKYHREKNADITLVLADKYNIPVGVAEIDDDGNIISLEEKPWLPLKVTIGILAIERDLVVEAHNKGLGTNFDIMGDLVPWSINNGKRVKGYIYSGSWYDVGSLERFVKLDHNNISDFLQVERHLDSSRNIVHR